jgi:activator of HSP90 ATPase
MAVAKSSAAGENARTKRSGQSSSRCRVGKGPAEREVERPKKKASESSAVKKATSAKGPVTTRQGKGKAIATEVPALSEAAPKAKKASASTTATISQSVLIRGASPKDVYRAFLNSKSHAKITGGPAKISARVEAEFSAWDGYIVGKNIALEEDKKIVQSWRTVEFPAKAPDSLLELIFEEEDGGTRIRLTQTGLPKSQAKNYELGWTQFYWGPMQKYFDDQR